MKITTPAKTIEACDCCGHNEAWRKCELCGGMYCWSCEPLIAACYGFFHICKKCGEREDVQIVAKKWAKRLLRSYSKRDAEIAALGPEFLRHLLSIASHPVQRTWRGKWLK